MSEVRRTACPLDCPDACSLDVEVEGGRLVSIDANRVNPYTAGFLCGKVRGFGARLHHDLRLRHPLVRSGRGGQLVRATWDEALDLVASRLRAAAERTGGPSILPFCYGGSNGRLTQDALDARLFRRLGASRLRRSVCAAATTAAAAGLYGLMPGVAPEDYRHAELVCLWGANPSASAIHLVPHVRRAVAEGARLVVVDPRRTPLARRAHQHLQLLPGTDLPLALSVLRHLFETGGADRAFLARHASGHELLRARAAPWTAARAAEVCGLEETEVRAFAELFAASNPAVIRCGWGLERNRNGGSAVCAVLALPAVGGKFGVRGGGYTMSNGGTWPLGTACDDPEPDTRVVNMNRLGRALVELEPPIDVLFVYDANPLSTLPDQEAVRRGLEREDLFTVVLDQVLTDTARLADVVLPATTFLEHADLRGSYGSYALQRTVPVVERVGEARPNYEVFQELLERLDLVRPGDGDGTPAALEERVLRDLPDVRERLDEEGVALPPFGTTPVQFRDVHPGTPSGRVELAPAALEAEAPGGLYAYRPPLADAELPLILISPATTRTVSSILGEVHEDLVPVGLHPEDAAARGIADGDPVRVRNARGCVETLARLDERLRPGVIELSKGIWSHNTRNGSTSNALVPDHLTDLGGGACFNDARAEVERIAFAGRSDAPRTGA